MAFEFGDGFNQSLVSVDPASLANSLAVVQAWTPTNVDVPAGNYGAYDYGSGNTAWGGSDVGGDIGNYTMPNNINVPAEVSGVLNNYYSGNSVDSTATNGGLVDSIYKSLFGEGSQAKGLLGQMLAGGASGMLQARAAEKAAKQQKAMLEMQQAHDTAEKAKNRQQEMAILASQQQFKRGMSAVPRMAVNSNFNWSR